MKATNLLEEHMITVPESWLKQVGHLAKKVSQQISDLPDEDHSILMKTDISALVGYASSADNVVKYNRIADNF